MEELKKVVPQGLLDKANALSAAGAAQLTDFFRGRLEDAVTVILHEEGAKEEGVTIKRERLSVKLQPSTKTWTIVKNVLFQKDQPCQTAVGGDEALQALKCLAQNLQEERLQLHQAVSKLSSELKQTQTSLSAAEYSLGNAKRASKDYKDSMYLTQRRLMVVSSELAAKSREVEDVKLAWSETVEHMATKFT
jgi:hypothetical protein